MALAKGATMGSSVEMQNDERSLNLDAIRASLEDAAAVLAEMTAGDARGAEGDTTAVGNHPRAGDSAPGIARPR